MNTRRIAAPLARGVLLAALVAAVVAPEPAQAQFAPYYGKNKVGYDTFAWRIYKSPHFEVYYYPEFEQHLSRVVSYAESSYQKVSSELKHEIGYAIPLILYKTHSEFEQTNLFPDILPEGVQAFAEPVRGRMVMPIDLPPDELQGLITHELTHVFEFDLIPRNLVQRTVPLWMDEGLADYMRGTWNPLDLMSIRDAAVTEQIPKMSKFESYGGYSNPRIVYNLGHAVFEFIEARFGKEGIRQFLYTFRKNLVGGGLEEIYQQAFRMKPEEFDEQFEKWLKERFKPFRDKQRPSDYGKDLSPDQEKTAFTQVFAFATSPSGEIIAALTGNRAEGEADLVLLSARDGSVIKNLTKGYTGEFESISMNEDFVAGRSLDFAPNGETVAFFARKGKRRSLYLASVLTGDIVRRVNVALDQAQAPCLLPDGRHALLAGIKEGVADIYRIDLETGALVNLTNDAFYDTDPQVSPDGRLVTYTRRISGNAKIHVFPLASPAEKTQVTFGAYDDTAPHFSNDGSAIFYSSTEDDDIYNIRSLDLKTGVMRQYTDVLGGNVAPEPVDGRGTSRVAFISYFKGEYHLQSIELGEPVKEVEQEVQVASALDIIDFQPDVTHQVVAQNKREKRTFEKLFLEGRPPLNVGVTSGGDFFGGSQVALSDVLADKNFVFTAMSLREFRSYDGTFIDLSRRFHYGVSAFDNTRFFYSDPYALQNPGFFREGAFATQRVLGANLIGTYPLNKFHRIDVQAGAYKLTERFENPESEFLARDAAAQRGVEFFLNNGTIAPLSVAVVGETTRFREFGPLSGSTYSVGFTVAPGVAGALSRQSFEVDARKYLQVAGTTLLAARVRGFSSTGDNPEVFYFGGNHELRGYQYLGLAGNSGFFANVELRLPIIHLLATPIGVLGPVRGSVYAGVGAARVRGQPFRFSSRESDISYVNYDPANPSTFLGEPVSGFHLVDGRASYGAGLQFFFLGYPMHFDWTKLTDFKVRSPGWKFDFWIGYDF